MPDIQAQTPDGVIHSFPDGTPPDVVDGAIKKYLGAKAAPQAGTQAFREQNARAVARNAQPTQFEKDNAPSTLGNVARMFTAAPLKALGFDTNSATPGRDWLKGNVKLAMDLVNPKRVGPPKVLSDVVGQMGDTSREGEMIRQTGRSVEPAQANEEGAMQLRRGGPVVKSGGELAHPELAAGVRTAASFLPVIGPGAVRAGHHLASEDPQTQWEGGAEAGAAVLQGVLGTREGQAAADTAIQKIGGPFARGGAKLMRAANSAVVKPVAESYTIGMPGEAMVKKGLAPYAKQTGYDAAMEKASDAIVQYHQDTPIKSVRDLHEALPDIQERVARERLNPVAQRHASEALPAERLERIKTAVESAAGPLVEEFDPGAAKDIRELAGKISRSRTIGELIGKDAGDRGGVMGYINGKLESYFAKYPSARKSELLKNPDTAGWEAARRAVREEVLDHLEQQGEGDIREARQVYGALEELQKTTERRVNVNDRAKLMDLPRILGAVGAVPSYGASVIAGEIAHHLNKPDVLVSRGLNRMMKNANLRTLPAEVISARTEPIGPGEGTAGPSAPKALPEPSAGLQTTTDSNGIRWAQSPDGYRVSIPKDMEEKEIPEYAAGKLEEQRKLHGMMKQGLAAPEKAAETAAPAAPAQGRTQAETNEIRAEISKVKQKIRLNSDRFSSARDWRAQNRYKENMEVAERRLGVLQDALEKGTPVSIHRGATKEELTETYRALTPEEKNEVTEMLQLYQSTEGYGRQALIDSYHLDRGGWKGLPMTERFARIVKSKGGAAKGLREPGEEEPEEAPF